MSTEEKTAEKDSDKKPAGPPKSTAREYFESFVVTLVMAIFGMTFILQAVTVPTGSMEPNILPGDKLIVNKMAYNLRIPFTDYWLTEFGKPERGDVIVFDYPLDPDVNFVKRVIGVPAVNPPNATP